MEETTKVAATTHTPMERRTARVALWRASFLLLVECYWDAEFGTPDNVGLMELRVPIAAVLEPLVPLHDPNHCLMLAERPAYPVKGIRLSY